MPSGSASHYSLGVMTYEFLAGDKPFGDDAGAEEIAASLPRALLALPEALRPVLYRALAPDRNARWESVEVFVAAFVNAAREER